MEYGVLFYKILNSNKGTRAWQQFLHFSSLTYLLKSLTAAAFQIDVRFVRARLFHFKRMQVCQKRSLFV
jgi:hypothetical protein